MIAWYNFSMFYVGVCVFARMQYVVSLPARKLLRTNRMERASQEVNFIPSTNEAIKQVSNIIDALEQLQVLESHPSNCYMLNRITRDQNQIEDDSYIVNVKIHVRQMQLQSLPGKDSSSNSSSQSCMVTGTSTTPDDSSSIVDLTSEKLLNDSTDKQSSQGNVTSESPRANMHDVKDHQGHVTHLSATQILVIVMCSTVIGLFFIIAVSLRVRNFLKRQRQQEEVSKRPTFRSTSMALRGSVSQHSPNKEAVSSKNNGLAEMQPNGGVFRRDSRLPGLITESINKPLLVITTASIPSSPQAHNNKEKHSNQVSDTTTDPGKETNSISSNVSPCLGISHTSCDLRNHGKWSHEGNLNPCELNAQMSQSQPWTRLGLARRVSELPSRNYLEQMVSGYVPLALTVGSKNCYRQLSKPGVQLSQNFVQELSERKLLTVPSPTNNRSQRSKSLKVNTGPDQTSCVSGYESSISSPSDTLHLLPQSPCSPPSIGSALSYDSTHTLESRSSNCEDCVFDENLRRDSSIYKREARRTSSSSSAGQRKSVTFSVNVQTEEESGPEEMTSLDCGHSNSPLDKEKLKATYV